MKVHVVHAAALGYPEVFSGVLGISVQAASICQRTKGDLTIIFKDMSVKLIPETDWSRILLIKEKEDR